MELVIWHKLYLQELLTPSNLDANDIYLTNKSNEQALKAFAEKLGVNYSYDDATLLKDADYVFLGTKTT